MKKMIVLLSVLNFTTACTSLGVKPWEKEVLSKKEMQFGSNPLQLGYEDHTYFSKEGSSGGRGFSAGGCGCN
jgi:hypothetical protein